MHALRGIDLIVGSGEVVAWLAIFVAGAAWRFRRDTARV